MGENLVSARQQQFDEIPAVLASTASDQCALSHLDLNMPCRSSLKGHHDPFQGPNAAFGGSGSSGRCRMVRQMVRQEQPFTKRLVAKRHRERQLGGGKWVARQGGELPKVGG